MWADTSPLREHLRHAVSPHHADAAVADAEGFLSHYGVDHLLREVRCAELEAAGGVQVWPYRDLMAGALENGQFDEAEALRRVWVANIDIYSRACALEALERSRADALSRRLDSVVGLTDPILVNLRRNLLAAIDSSNTPEVARLQGVIATRVLELRPPPPPPAPVVVAPPTPTAVTTNVNTNATASSTINVQAPPRPPPSAEAIGDAVSGMLGHHGVRDNRARSGLRLLDLITGAQ
jgi:hypothetical protein